MLKAIAEILTVPAITLGLVALLGLLLQKKEVTDVVKGTIKTILGILILGAGSSLIVTNLSPFATMFEEAFQLTGVVPVDEAVIAALVDSVAAIGRMTSFILLFGFLTNIVLARLTPFKYIFLTGHMMWILAGALAWAFHDLGVSETYGIIFGSIIHGIVLVLLPAISQPIVRKITGNDKVAYGHLTTTGVVASAWVGKVFGNKEQDSEKIKMPEKLSFFKDTAVSVSLIMFIIYIITALFAGPEVVNPLSDGQNYLVFSTLNALGFAAGVLVLLQGVRMFLGEIVPAFRGIALKIVPGAKPALDVPIFFPYAPNALMLGFLFSIIGMIVGMLVSTLFGTIVPLPSIIGGFFTGGIAGIFGNAMGGRRGAMISGLTYGIILTVPVALFYPLFGLEVYGVEGLAFLVPDGIIVLALIKLFFTLDIPIIGFIALLAAFILLSMFYKKKTSLES
ncbi:PTS ascorbate transporter subunit IIC [Virgibacillus pantothenticus]|uniref:Ascorbate-specific PTS system EIIC component n=1 Tax=Virgibacillus pantothenticus TaxID=1473 RepID=A0A0L0QVP0_VIRPA|nr:MULTISPECIES: PTS ascorbate transporter subunit IIC [Virgibacillus]API92538.1 PTS ascorbate transporter subunit IIC [Virgibacillus sp. 6R]KNE22283.1 PTS ascorbate transporter subunit IIC [Virgibacillus pantothenticus]MBS7428017.1 PTS ascorbate transporter subunit IIC [Virgibacillus sp. 19R1-5]MBU8568575.1 PTS ascorbate transporter subunit IIC [Virgibacillus pantothenticus]MBU8602597.1 PTS ascorbate transporter subunit IIC [Virgibacillus pantothenticus]